MSFVDGHCDTLTYIYDTEQDFYKHDGHLDMERLMKLEYPVQFFAICTNPRDYGEALPFTLKIIETFYRIMDKNADNIAPALKFDDIAENRKNKKATAVLAIEGLYQVGNHIEVISTLYRLGVRLAGFTWNYSNSLASGLMEWKKSEGLTALGVEAVKLMNEIGMIIDVSHMSEKSFWDVIEHTKKPITATHSNAYEVMNHARNLKNDQIKAIAETGGTIGINFYEQFVSTPPTLEALLNHIDHIVKIGGEDVIAIGSDFDGMDSAPPELLDVLGQRILMEAVEKKYGSNFRDKMAEGNLLRVMKEVWK